MYIHLRVYYPGSDLDLFVSCKHGPKVCLWLEANGYVFVPDKYQRKRIIRTGHQFKYPPDMTDIEGGMRIAEGGAESLITSLSIRYSETTAEDYYSAMNGIAAVLHFYGSASEGHSRAVIDVVVIEPKASPLACILNSHSSTFITTRLLI
jgi:hypothetical protein